MALMSPKIRYIAIHAEHLSSPHALTISSPNSRLMEGFIWLIVRQYTNPAKQGRLYTSLEEEEM